MASASASSNAKLGCHADRKSPEALLNRLVIRIKSGVGNVLACDSIRDFISEVASTASAFPRLINSKLLRYSTIWRENCRASVPLSRAR